MRFSGEAFSRLLPPDAEAAAPGDQVGVFPSQHVGATGGWGKPTVFVVGGRFYQQGRFSQVITGLELKITRPDGSGIKMTPRPRFENEKNEEKNTEPLPRFDGWNPFWPQIRLHQKGKPERQTALVMLDPPALLIPATSEFLGEKLEPGDVVSSHARFSAYAFENCDLEEAEAKLPTHRFDWGIDVEMTFQELPTVPTGTIRQAPGVTIVPDPDVGEESPFKKAENNDPGEGGAKGEGAEPGFRATPGTVIKEPFKP